MPGKLKDVDGRNKSGHDAASEARSIIAGTTRARNDKAKAFLATRRRPSFAASFHETVSPMRGGGAPKGASNQCPRIADKFTPVCATHLRAEAARSRGPLAFRRSTAALAPATERQDSAQAALHAFRCEGVTFAYLTAL